MSAKSNKSAILSARSTVGMNMRMGILPIKSVKDYDRKRFKRELRRKIHVEQW